MVAILQSLGKQGESDHSLEILENLEIPPDILESTLCERPLL